MPVIGASLLLLTGCGQSGGQKARTPSSAGVSSSAAQRSRRPAAALTTTDIERRYSAAFNRCVEAASGMDSAFAACLGEEQSHWDAALNATYRRYMATLPPERRAEFRQQERAWIRDTGAKCEHAGDENAGGTAQPVEIASCYL